MALTTEGPTIVGVVSAFLVINTVCIALRCYTRAAISKNFNYNDLFMILTVGVYAILLALIALGVKNGIGAHTDQATIPGIGECLKYIFFLEIIYVILTSVMKASLAITLQQWAKKKIHSTLLWTAIVIDVIICLIVVLYFLFQCQPISYAWRLIDPSVKGKCLPITGQIYMGYALCAVTITLDMLFLFVPFFILHGRGVNSRLKLYIYGIFSLGVLASVANFIRLATLVKLASSVDPLFDAAPVFLWSAIEVSIGISTAGIMELRPLMQRYKVKGFEDSFGQIYDDTMPIRLQSVDKSTISFAKSQEVGSQI